MKERKTRAVEVDGIAFELAIDPANDYELAACSTTAHDPAATPVERSRAIDRMHRLVLGGERQRVLDEIRSRNGGALPIEAVNSFVNRAISQAVEAKN